MGDLIEPIRPEVLAIVRDELCLPGTFYINAANIYVYGDSKKSPSAFGEFSVRNSGHWKFDTGAVHAQDSLACAAQLAYAFFIQSSIDGLFSQIPSLPIEKLRELVKDKSGGTYLAGIHESRYKFLPKDFTGTLDVTSIHGGNGISGCSVNAVARLGDSPRNHYMELEFGILFPKN